MYSYIAIITDDVFKFAHVLKLLHTHAATIIERNKLFNVTHCYSNRSCPKGICTAKLSVDHAYLVSKSWRIFEPDDCLQYLKNILKNYISVGVFLESDPSQPVSWAFLSNFGYISGSHTLKEYRRNGY